MKPYAAELDLLGFFRERLSAVALPVGDVGDAEVFPGC